MTKEVAVEQAANMAELICFMYKRSWELDEPIRTLRREGNDVMEIYKKIVKQTSEMADFEIVSYIITYIQELGWKMREEEMTKASKWAEKNYKEDPQWDQVEQLVVGWKLNH